jgi:hypothetical protein
MKQADSKGRFQPLWKEEDGGLAEPDSQDKVAAKPSGQAWLEDGGPAREDSRTTSIEIEGQRPLFMSFYTLPKCSARKAALRATIFAISIGFLLVLLVAGAPGVVEVALPMFATMSVVMHGAVLPWIPGEEALVNATGIKNATDDVENPTYTLGEADVVAEAMKWGWAAFEVNASGAVVPTLNLTSAVVYQELTNGSDGCPEGLEIASQDECRQAVESLGMTVSDTWSGSVTDAPRFCSVTVKDVHTIIVNLNSAKANTTKGRADVKPVCLTVPRPEGCPACVSSKRIIPSVVLPFYERDLCKFSFTARSIPVHDPNHLLGDVYFLWISYTSPWGYMSTIQGTIDEVNQTHTVHFYDLSGVVRGGGQLGWNAQQILKLKAASVVTSDYYIVLDSKNTLIKDVESDTLVTSCNQAKTFAAYTAWSMPNPHKGWYYNTAARLGVPWPAGGQWPDSISPMTLHTKTVVNMLHAVGEDPNLWALCRGPLCGWMRGQGATEFILYQLYSHYRTDYQCLHASRWPIVGSMWRGRTSAASIDQESGATKSFFGAQSGAFGGIWGWARSEAGRHLRQVFVDAGLVNESDSSVSPDFLMGCIG